MPQSQRSPTAEHPPGIQVGDTVAYTQAFLDRNSRYPNGLAAAQGTVKALHPLDNGSVLADIDWNNPGLPKRVNVKNLAPRHATACGDSPSPRSSS
jgi:hypothetical protein